MTFYNSGNTTGVLRYANNWSVAVLDSCHVWTLINSEHALKHVRKPPARNRHAGRPILHAVGYSLGWGNPFFLRLLLSPDGLGEREKGFVSGHLPGVLPGYRRVLQFIATIHTSGEGGPQTYGVTWRKEREDTSRQCTWRVLGYNAV
jgi:hypothetical protein